MQRHLEQRLEGDLTHACQGLAVCFCLPEKELLHESSVVRGLPVVLRELDPTAAGHAKDLVTALESEAERELQVDYARLFVGPQELLAPPYGSVYLDGAGQIMGNTTLEVLSAYRDGGLTVDESAHEPPDHIALELEFLHYLGSLALQAGELGRFGDAGKLLAQRRQFLAANVTPWVPAFCLRVRQHARTAFYGAAASCLERVVALATAQCEEKS